MPRSIGRIEGDFFANLLNRMVRADVCTQEKAKDFFNHADNNARDTLFQEATVKIDKSAKPTATTPVPGGNGRANASSSSSQGAPGTSSNGAGSAGVPSAGISSTSVHIGEAASHLQSAVASAPAIDMNKVAAVRQAISEGRFQVNAQVVAEGLIASVRQLVQSHGH